MPDNDLLLLDSLVQKSRNQYGTRQDESEYFELFSIDNVLKNFDCSLEQLEEGWVDGGDDGGIDGFYVFIDGISLSEQLDLKRVRSEPIIEIYILTVKLGETFRQTALTLLLGTLVDLFDLRNANLANPYFEPLVELRQRFRKTYIELADKNPSMRINIVYCSRGDSKKIAKNVQSKAKQLSESITKLFSRCSTDVRFLGASELLQLAQRKKRYSLILPYTETFISRDGTNYVILCRLKDYLAFITDEDGELRRYLFDGNVRAYLGDVQVNANIANTLKEEHGVDFWWLNNGITILASNTTVAGKQLNIENVLIVNGLQTTETLYRTLHNKLRPGDERALLVKIIISTDDVVRARIIKATNYQNSVELASLRSLDQIQKNIEQFLFDNGWFYERRSNHYRNQGKPADRILSISQLGAAVRALIFRTPRTAERRQRWLRSDTSYHEVFNEAWPLDLFLACANVVRSVEIILNTKMSAWEELDFLPHLRRGWLYMISLVVVCVRLRDTKYEARRLGELARAQITISEVVAAAGHVLATFAQFSDLRYFHMTRAQERTVLLELARQNYAHLSPKPLSSDALVPVEEKPRKRRRRRKSPRAEVV